MNKLLIGLMAFAALFVMISTEAYYTPQLDFTIESPQNNVAVWDEYTPRIYTHLDRDGLYKKIENADVTIKIKGVSNKKYNYVEGTTIDGYFAHPFLIRDYEYRTDRFYNVSVTVNWNDQTKIKYTGFWVHQRTP